MTTLARILAEVTALRAEVAELRGARLATRREGLTATEAAEMLGCDRKTFYRRHAPRLARNRVTNRFSREAIERELRAMEGA